MSYVKIKQQTTVNIFIVRNMVLYQVFTQLKIQPPIQEAFVQSCGCVLGSVVKEDRILQAMPNVVLALHLLCEKCNPESFWSPYISILYTVHVYNTIPFL